MDGNDSFVANMATNQFSQNEGRQPRDVGQPRSPQFNGYNRGRGGLFGALNGRSQGRGRSSYRGRGGRGNYRGRSSSNAPGESHDDNTAANGFNNSSLGKKNKPEKRPYTVQGPTGPPRDAPTRSFATAEEINELMKDQDADAIKRAGANFLEKLAIQHHDKPKAVRLTKFPIAMRFASGKHQGKWIGSVQKTAKTLQINFHYNPDGISSIEFTHEPATAPNIGIASRPERYLKRAIFNHLSLLRKPDDPTGILPDIEESTKATESGPAATDKSSETGVGQPSKLETSSNSADNKPEFNIIWKTLTWKDLGLSEPNESTEYSTGDLPTPLVDLLPENLDNIMMKGYIKQVKLRCKKSDVISVNMWQGLEYSDQRDAKQSSRFESIFDNEEYTTIEMLVRETFDCGTDLFKAILEDFEDDVIYGDYYMQHYPFSQRNEESPPIPMSGQTSSELPDCRAFYPPTVYSDMFRMGTAFFHSEELSQQYQDYCVDKFKNAEGHTIKFLEIPGAGRTKYLAVCQFDPDTYQGVNIQPGDKFYLRVYDKTEGTSPYWTMTVTESTNITQGSELLCFAQRSEEREKIENPTAEQKGQAPKLNAYKIKPGGIIIQDLVSFEQARDLIYNTCKYNVVDVILHNPNLTHRRRQYAMTTFIRGKHRVLIDDGSGAQEWKIIAGVKNLKDILTGHRRTPQKLINMIPGCRVILEKLNDLNLSALVNYLENSPDAFAVVQGIAGSGKTGQLAMVALAKAMVNYSVLSARMDKGEVITPENITSAGILFTAESNAACDAIIERCISGKKLLDIDHDNDLILVARLHSDPVEKQTLMQIASGHIRQHKGKMSEKERAAYSKFNLLVPESEIKKSAEDIKILKQVADERRQPLKRGFGRRKLKTSQEDAYELDTFDAFESDGDESVNDPVANGGNPPSEVVNDKTAIPKEKAPTNIDLGRTLDDTADINLDGTLAEMGATPEDLDLYTHIIRLHNDSIAPGSGVVSDKRMQHIKYSIAYLVLQTAGLTPHANRYTKWGREEFKGLRIFYTKYVTGVLPKDEDFAFREEIRRASIFILQHVDIAVTTTSTSATALYRENSTVNLLIFDEGGLTSVSSFMIPLAHYHDVPIIVAGDMFQGCPVYTGPKVKKGLWRLQEESVFALKMKHQWPRVDLDTQRRSAAGVYLVANAVFYGNTVVDGPQANDESAFPEKIDLIRFCKEKFPASEDVNQKFPGHDNIPCLLLSPLGQQSRYPHSLSCYNSMNAALGLNIIVAMEKFSNGRILPGHWGLITPYKDQKNLYEAARQKYISDFPLEDIAAWNANKAKWLALTIATTDSFRGSDRPLIIVDNVITDRVGFLNDEGRACVSATRSKCGWIMISRTDKIISNDEIHLIEKRQKGDLEYNYLSIMTRMFKEFSKLGRLRTLSDDHPMLSHNYVPKPVEQDNSQFESKPRHNNQGHPDNNTDINGWGTSSDASGNNGWGVGTGDNGTGGNGTGNNGTDDNGTSTWGGNNHSLSSW